MAVSNPCKPKKPRLRGCVSSGFAWTCAQVPSWRQGGSIFAHWEQNYKALYPHRYDGPHFDWPPYRPVREGRDQVEHVRFEYAALVSMCDHYLGQILNSMDRYGLWDDTMLIVNTDHGFLLGEHDWWAKCVQPFYSEVARTPLFIWDPRCACQGERRSALVQTIDLPATLLDYFGLDLPATMQGAALREAVAADRPVRAAALFGLHGGHVNVTDGCYVYMRGPHSPDTEPLYEYTLMPTHMRTRFSVGELHELELAEPFDFTKGCRTLRIPARGGSWQGAYRLGTLLCDLRSDPCQEQTIDEPEVEKRLLHHLVRLMRESDAPPEQFTRLGLHGA
jgi:hypothetical protein